MTCNLSNSFIFGDFRVIFIASLSNNLRFLYKPCSN